MFPIGGGPVEAIWTRLLGRIISSDVACTEARTLGQHGDSIAPYAQVLAVYLVGQADRGQPTKALQLSTVVLAMAEAQLPTKTDHNGTRRGPIPAEAPVAQPQVSDGAGQSERICKHVNGH